MAFKNSLSIKIDPSRIVRDHLSTLVNVNTKKTGMDDKLIFFLFPVLASVLLIYNGFLVNEKVATVALSALAIFVGLLFNALVILIDVARKSVDHKRRLQLIKQLSANISFSILVAFFAIVFLVLPFFDIEVNHWLIYIASGIVFCFLIEFILVFAMILKRVYAVFSDEFNRIG
jgi:hypothetical protein